MILLFSEKRDFSTNKVIDWLIYWKQIYLRHNGVSDNDSEIDFQKTIHCIHIENDYNNCDISRGDQLVSKEVKSVWYRRPYNGVEDFYIPLSRKKTSIPVVVINKQLKSHFKILKDLIITFFSTSKVLGSYYITSLNKPTVLLKARKHGLNIPNTLITNSLSDLKSFFECNNKKIICKALHEGIFNFPKKNPNFGFAEATNLIEDISFVPKKFATSLFQEYIEKDYELRIVFLNNNLYSMCIFSQNNPKTMIDFRNYDEKRPNRMIPYLLDDTEAQKIRSLMDDIGLNIESIDLIKARDEKYEFLEFKPVGHNDFVSYHCNYHIHHEIAEFLTNEK